MKLSFQWKMRITICLLSVSLTSLGVYLFYTSTYQVTIGLLKKNLRDVGNVGAMLLDHECREAIKRLKAAALREVIFDRKVINELAVGETTKSIAPEKVEKLHASKDFQLILRRLKMINHASYKTAIPLSNNYDVELFSGFNNGMMGSYLMIKASDTLPDNICMYLVSSIPEPTADGWPGNPIGNIFRAFEPWHKIKQEITILDDVIEDEFYQSLSCGIPILDDNNNTIASLGLDYAVGRELSKLNRLKWICVALIVGSFILSFLLSSIISKFLNTPLERLTEGVKDIGKGNLKTRVKIHSNDEFELLAHEFNNMTQNLENITVSRDELEAEIIQKRHLEKQKEKMIEKLKAALDEIKTLKGIVPICSNCKKIRDDKGYWNVLEAYIQAHTDASFSHGICPECSEALYGKEDWYKKMKNKS